MWTTRKASNKHKRQVGVTKRFAFSALIILFLLATIAGLARIAAKVTVDRRVESVGSLVGKFGGSCFLGTDERVVFVDLQNANPSASAFEQLFTALSFSKWIQVIRPVDIHVNLTGSKCKFDDLLPKNFTVTSITLARAEYSVEDFTCLLESCPRLRYVDISLSSNGTIGEAHVIEALSLPCLDTVVLFDVEISEETKQKIDSLGIEAMY